VTHEHIVSSGYILRAICWSRATFTFSTNQHIFLCTCVCVVTLNNASD